MISINLDFSQTFNSTGSSPETNSITVAGASYRLLLVHAHGTATGAFTNSCTFNGVAMNKFDTESVSWPTQNTVTTIFYLVAPDVGTHDVVFTYSGSVGYYAISATSLNGVTQTNPIEQSLHPNFDFVISNTSLTSTFSTTADNAWQVVAYITGFAPATFTATLGTLQSQGGVTQKMGIVTRGPLSPAGSFGTTVTVPVNNNYGAVGISISPHIDESFTPQVLIL